MTEIALQRFASVPSSITEEIAEHARGCPRCRWSTGPLVKHLDTRACAQAEAYVERAVNYLTALNHPNGGTR